MQTKLQNQMYHFRRLIEGNVLTDAANAINDIQSRMEQANEQATRISESAEHAGYTDLMNEADDFAQRLLNMSDALRRISGMMDDNNIADMPDALDEMAKKSNAD